MTHHENQILQSIYNNAKNAMDILSLLSEKSTDRGFCSDLSSQWQEYRKISDQVIVLLSDAHTLPQEPPFLERFLMLASLFTTSAKQTPQLAQLLISGSSQGITELKKKLNRNTVSVPIQLLADQLIFLEQSNMFLMYRYL